MKNSNNIMVFHNTSHRQQEKVSTRNFKCESSQTFFPVAYDNRRRRKVHSFSMMIINLLKLSLRTLESWLDTAGKSSYFCSIVFIVINDDSYYERFPSLPTFHRRPYELMFDSLDSWARIKAHFISSKQLLLKRAFLFQ